MAVPPSAKSSADRFIIPFHEESFASFYIQPKTLYHKYLVKALVPHYGQVRSCAPSKKFNFPTTIKKPIWQLSNNPTQNVDTEMSSNFYANPLDWSPQFLAKGSLDTPTLWQHQTNNNQEIPSHDALVTTVKLDPQSFQLASGDCMSCLRITDIATKTLLLERSAIDEHDILSMDWRSPHELTFGTWDSVYHADIRSGQIQPIDIPKAQQICALTWKEEGPMCAIGSNDDHARVIDLRRLDQPNLFHVHTHKAAVKALRWIPNCNEPLLLSGGATGCRTFKVVNVNDHSVACEEITKAQICSIDFVGNRYFVAGFGFGTETDNLQLWRYLPNIPKLEKICAKTMVGRVLNVAWEPKRSFVAASSSLGHLEVWELESTKTSQSLETPPSIFDKFVVR